MSETQDDWREAWNRVVSRKPEGLKDMLERFDRVVEDGLQLAEKHHIMDAAAARSIREVQPFIRDTVQYFADVVKTATEAGIGPVSPVGGIPKPPPKPIQVTVTNIFVGPNAMKAASELVDGAAMIARSNDVVLLGGSTEVDA